MTQQQENFSAFVDGEQAGNNDELIKSISRDPELSAKWQRYHVIRDGLRGELADEPSFDIAANIAQAIEQEPAILAPKRRIADIPVIGQVIPLVKQSGQLLVAASVAAVAILGFQNFNSQTVEETQPFVTAPPLAGPQGGLAPVSLEQTRPVTRNDMAALLEQRRQLNALIADHERQLQIQQAQVQGNNAEAEAQNDDSNQQPE